MKNLVLTLGLVILPFEKQTKSLLPPPPPLTPYIQTSVQTSKPNKQLKTKNNLVDALILVESAGNPKANNKKENAVGCLQIRPIMVREVNRILRKQKSEQRFTREDRWDCGKSQEMFYIWVNYHHPTSSDEMIARNWNGGPRGYKKQSTEHYWQKVQKAWAN
jgi:hypothetical protein